MDEVHSCFEQVNRTFLQINRVLSNSLVKILKTIKTLKNYKTSEIQELFSIKMQMKIKKFTKNYLNKIELKDN